MELSNIGRGLQKQRKNSGLSIKDAVKRLKDYEINVSEQTVYSWESGRRMPDADSLLALCEIYATPDILDAFGYTQPKDEFEALQQLHEITKHLPLSDQEYLLELARRLSKLKQS